MVALYEKLRPKSLDEIVGFRDAVSQLESLRDCLGWGGQVFWLSGGSGNGKTTIARIIAADVAENFEIQEIDAQDLTLDLIREWERRCNYYPLKTAHAFIVNEAHMLHTKAVSKLQTTLEAPCVQKNGTFIFTTTDKGQQHLFDTRFDAFPFLSRAIIVDLKMDEQTIIDIASHLKSTAEKLGLGGGSLESYMQMLADTTGNGTVE